MDSSLFSIFSGKYFNQNLICFILSYLGVFFAKYYNICCLDYFCYGLLLVSICSLFVTIGVYTWEYLQRKAYKARCHEVRYNYAKKIALEDPSIRVIKTEGDRKKETKEILLPKDIVDWGD